jgi:hypothetical protein
VILYLFIFYYILSVSVKVYDVVLMVMQSLNGLVELVCPFYTTSAISSFFILYDSSGTQAIK